jgi:two-component system cell cycle response regulator DivK
VTPIVYPAAGESTLFSAHPTAVGQRLDDEGPWPLAPGGISGDDLRALALLLQQTLSEPLPAIDLDKMPEQADGWNTGFESRVNEELETLQIREEARRRHRAGSWREPQRFDLSLAAEPEAFFATTVASSKWSLNITSRRCQVVVDRANRVLVVEDNPANQLLAREVLERDGFVVDVADSAAAARESLARNRPDLILMDIQPAGEDGLALTGELKADAATDSIPVVAITAHAMIGDKHAALAAGCVGYIAKPIDTRSLARQAREFIASQPPKLSHSPSPRLQEETESERHPAA